jgi:methionine-rich copper-binding protein CopC
MHRLFLGFAALAVTVLFGASLAQAHSYPDHSSPLAESVLARSPAKVSIWFTEALEPKYSAIDVTDADGNPVKSGRSTLDPKNPTLLEVRLKPLMPGRYTVKWHVTAVDTHATQGEFSFTVAKS